MRIAFIGWGSLVWSPRGLPLASGWAADGPELPIEFARKSRDGRLTLVLFETAAPIPTYWAQASASDFELARSELREREGTTAQFIHGSLDDSATMFHAYVNAWLSGRTDVDAALWTALGSTPEGQSDASAISYLKALDDEPRRRAEEYVRRAPDQTRTVRRTLIERELGWTPTGSNDE